MALVSSFDRARLAKDSAEGETRGMLNFVQMIEHGCHRLGGIVLVVGMAIVSVTALSGEERAHPSLVDPVITKCTVCHKDVGGTHPVSASQQACLNCHRFEKRAKKTILIVEDAPRARDADDVQRAVETSGGESEREGQDSPVAPDRTAPRSDPTPAAPIDEIAPVRPRPVPVARSETSPPERKETVVESGGADSAGRLYAEGMAAFNRGDFNLAFQTWRLMFADKPDHYVVQVEVDTYLESAQSTVATYGGHSLYVLKKDDLYWVFSGFFATQAEAIEALRLLPEPLRQGGAFPIEVRQILPQQ